ncbi:hypothetical protein LX32DRAFT_13343 [Colletotrichum zoysiae]|uniref:Uncharacterized protein n=1 Tax=Colletotrichum zoysiae TaxID=1216348 RepID=A0AAD9HCU9_9PEZI|nr:hypothetical protein LX32DRAFT_13343 [Colletotrichum zoysiae]
MTDGGGFFLGWSWVALQASQKSLRVCLSTYEISQPAAPHLGPPALLHHRRPRHRRTGREAAGWTTGTPVEVTVAVGRRKRMRVLFAGQTSQQRRVCLSLYLSRSLSPSCSSGMFLVAAPTLAWLAESVLPDRVDPCAVDHRLGNQSLKHLPLPGRK